MVVAACGEEPMESPPGAPEFAACGSTAACAQDLICVDGICRQHAWGDPGSPVVHLDAVGGDGATAEVTSEDGSGEDAQAINDADPGVDAEEVVDAGADGATMVELYLKEDTADVAVSEVLVPLTLGQAWVSQISVPNPGQLIGLEVQIAPAAEGAVCGRLQPLLWDKSAIVSLTGTPYWTGPDGVEVTGGEDVVFLPIDTPPDLLPGTYRIGVRYLEACGDGVDAPVIVADQETLGGSWVFTEGGASQWSSAATLEVTGRFAIRAWLGVAL